MQRTQIHSVGGKVERTGADSLDRLHRIHHLRNRQASRTPQQLNTATSPAVRCENSRLSERLDHLGKVGPRHLSRRGNPRLLVPLVQMNALMGFVSDALLSAVLALGLERATEVRTLRALNRLLWLQNDLITRHYQQPCATESSRTS